MKTKYCLPALLWPVVNLFAQTSLSGVVHTKNNLPLAHVTIGLRESETQTLTNTTGAFLLILKQPLDTLVVSAVGYRLYKLPVTAGTGFIDISLEESTTPLDEVVVIGYGTTTRRYSTGSVATVSAADIAKQPVANPLAALEGRVPGLLVTQSSGVPGSSFAVQVRGQGSLLQGSDPLFVVDGVPYAPNNNPVNNLGSAAAATGGGLSPFSSLNPADIESISVLKDADATAIYGSRGANGVILITTKKGKNGKTTFSLNAYTGGSRATQRVQLLKTEDYLIMRREAFQNDGALPDAENAPDLTLWDTARYTDFGKELVGGTAGSSDVQASLSGGSGNTQFLLSGGYHRETTVFPGDLHDKRGSLNSSLTHTSNNKKLLLSLSILYSNENNSILVADLSGQTRLAPDAPPLYDSTGALSWRGDGITFNNPLSYLQQTYRAVTDNGLGNLNLSYRVAPGLTIRLTGGYHIYGLSEVNTNPATSQNPIYSPQGYTLFGETKLRSWIAEPGAEYTATLLRKLHVNALAGGTVQDTRNRYSSLFAYGYSNDQLLESPSAAASLFALSSGSTAYKYAALFGRLNLVWNDRYILNLSGRRDGSSRFGPGKQFANFGAIGAAWLFANEKGIQKALPFLSYGKLRAGYGSTGNDQIGDYNYLNTWSPAGFPYNGMAGLYPTRLFNPSYSWEINRKAELGLDLGLWHDRILLNSAFFRNRSSNQLVSYSLPSQTGFASILENLPATIQNTGLELSLTTKNIDRTNFSWTTTFNLSIPKNKLLSFPGLVSSAYASRYVVGKSVSIVRGYRYEGVDPQTGVFRFTDANKDGVLNPDDMNIIADLSPKYYGGFGNTFSCKGFSLDLFFQFKKGTGLNELSSIYNPYLAPPGGLTNEPSAVLSRWQKPGDQSNYQRFTATPGTDAYNALLYLSSSAAVYSNASYLRLKNAAISYTLPTTLLTKWGAGTCRVYAQAQNLLTITGYRGTDPETQNLFSLPPLRTITGGIQITF